MPADNVKVCVRQRPVSSLEAASGAAYVWDVEGDVIQEPISGKLATENRGQHKFVFDLVCSPSTTKHIYEEIGSSLLQAAMRGLNATIFAYGQTNSGKTYTMKGVRDDAGLIPLAIREMFQFIQDTPEREYLLRVSYLEIYNEIVNDLLVPASSNLALHQDPTGSVHVEGLAEVVVGSEQQVMSLLASGDAYRHVSKTDYNACSSRSHCVFRVIVESKDRNVRTPPLGERKRGAKSCGSPVRISCLNLIDLAGSEKISREELRRKEGAFINRSLLTLGNVISKLSEGRGGHIPYRDSKLTRILQNSLTGNSKILVVCTISPTISCREETLNTLKFASRAKKITTLAQLNEILDDRAMLKRYKIEIKELREKLRAFQQNSCSQSPNLERKIDELERKNEQMAEELQEKDLLRVAMKERIHQLTKMILTSTVSASDSLKRASEPGKKSPKITASFDSSDPSFSPPSCHTLEEAGADESSGDFMGKLETLRVKIRSLEENSMSILAPMEKKIVQLEKLIENLTKVHQDEIDTLKKQLILLQEENTNLLNELQNSQSFSSLSTHFRNSRDDCSQ